MRDIREKTLNFHVYFDQTSVKTADQRLSESDFLYSTSPGVYEVSARFTSVLQAGASQTETAPQTSQNRFLKKKGFKERLFWSKKTFAHVWL